MHVWCEDALYERYGTDLISYIFIFLLIIQNFAIVISQ